MLSDEYLLRGDPSEVADFLGVSARTLRRYKSAPHLMPEACKRLLRFRMNGDLLALTGNKNWTGFYLCHDGSLHVPLFEKSFHANHIALMFFDFQHMSVLKQQVRDMEAKLWAIEKVRTAERTGSLQAKMQQHAEALRVLSAAVTADLDENALIDEFRRESFPK